MQARFRPTYSVKTYFELDRRFAEGRLEYWHGEIYAMAGASTPHNRVCTNLMQILAALPDDCEVLGSDQRVAVDEDAFVYPDLTVACDAQTPDDILVNPKVVVEVLSPSTEAFDRNEKGPAYQQMPSVDEVLLIHPNRLEVEHWQRTADGWSHLVYTGQESVLQVHGVDVALRHLYKRVIE